MDSQEIKAIKIGPRMFIPQNEIDRLMGISSGQISALSPQWQIKFPAMVKNVDKRCQMRQKVRESAWTTCWRDLHHAPSNPSFWPRKRRPQQKKTACRFASTIGLSQTW